MGGKKPYLVALLIQVIYAGMFLISKSAFNDGFNSFVFVFYRQLIGTIVLAPFAIIFCSKGAPPLSIMVLFKIFGLSLLGGTLCLNLCSVGIVYTSATMGAAAINILPVATFIFALLLRMETMKLNTVRGIAKLVGLVLCMAGALILAFYKGPHLKPLIHHRLLGHQNAQGGEVMGSGKRWIIGCFMILTANSLWSLWLVLQAKFLESYPATLLFTTLQCTFSVFQSFVVAMIFERNLQKWKLHWDIGLISVIYSGALTTAAVFYLQSWCMEMKGPVFLAMSSPLSLIFTITYSSVLLGESVTLGSVIGGILLAGSLYSVLWGKGGEQKSPVTLATNEEDHENKEEEKVVMTYMVEDTIKHKLDQVI